MDPNGVSVVVCVCVFPALATFIVAMRLWARATQSSGIGLDDGMICVALVSSLASVRSSNLVLKNRRS